jgi:hypothetical protein
MSNRNPNHMISKFRWDTLFDKKEKGSELQERLSHWSRINMPKDVTDLFDKVCPPEQIWRIQSLEIDLGLIDYNDLEFELSARLRTQLSEKLIDLIIYANRGGKELEILNEDTSYIYLISSFLLNGIMPWTYNPDDGSVNHMLAAQLQTNKPSVIDMISTVGVTYENVRKRIAWQVSEPNIIKIIAGLEPNNHIQIIDFSNELIKIQAKETIVQTSARDFRKQLWLWILNYLLTERGSIFSKVAYMRSTIRQMANHYNIAYTELINLIERAVIAVSKVYGVKADFLATINIIANENTSVKRETGLQVGSETDLWNVLLRCFKNISPRSKTQKADFNELIISLSKQNRLKFRELLRSVGYAEKQWLNTIKDLNRASVEAIFLTLNEHSGRDLFKSLDFLSDAFNKINVKVEREVLYNTSLRFLYNHNSSSAGVAAFLSYHIAEISKLKQLKKTQLLNKVTNIESTKTASTLKFHNNLIAIYLSEIGNTDSEVLKSYFEDTLGDLIKQLLAPNIDKERFYSVHKTLSKNILLYPKIALAALFAHPDKNKLELLTYYILDNYTTNFLFERLDKTNPVFNYLQVIILEVKANQTYSILPVNEVLIPIALQSILLKQGSAAAILEHIIVQFRRQITVAQGSVFDKLLNQLVGQKRLPYFKSPVDTAISENKNIIEKISSIISSSASRQEEVCGLISKNLNNKAIIQLCKYKSQINSDILNYITPNGEQLLNSFIKEYIAIIQGKTEQEIVSGLTELYWICITNYANHRGQAARLAISFRAAVSYHFNLSDLKKAEKITNYLPQGKQLMNTLIKEYFSILKSAIPGVNHAEILNRLSNLYKKCLTDYNIHQGRSEALNLLFRKSVLAEFSISEKFVLPENMKSPKQAEANFKHPDKYFSDQPNLILDALVSEYTIILKRQFPHLTETEIISKLIELQHELLAGSNENITSKLIAETFKAKVLATFDITDKSVLANHDISNFSDAIFKTYLLQNNTKITGYQLFDFIEKGIKDESGTIKVGKSKIKLSEFLVLGFDINPSLLREIISYTLVSQKRVDLFTVAIPLNQFCIWIAAGASSNVAIALESIRLLYDITLLCAPGRVATELLNRYYWHQSWKIITTNTFSNAELKVLVQHSFYLIMQQTDVDTESIILAITRNNIRLTPVLQSALTEYIPNFANNLKLVAEPHAALLLAEQKELIYELSYGLIILKQIQPWYPGKDLLSAEGLLNEIIQRYPDKILLVLKQEIVPAQQMQWLHGSVNFKLLIASIAHLNRSRQSQLHIIEQFYKALGHVSISGISSTEIQYILFKKTIKAWSTDNWKIISVKNIWNELIWEICTQRGVTSKDFIAGIEKLQISLPPSLHISFNQLKDQHETAKSASPKIDMAKPIKQMLQKQQNSTAVKGGIPLRNAGMVILNSYIPMLFDRLGLTADRKFLDIPAQCNAVHYLQYVITGLSTTEESLLPLNKVLCGLPLSYPIPDGISITDEQTKLIEGLIQAVIGHWPAIGSTSTDGLRGNWLVRDGLLVELEERWELTVEKRAYDLLIHKSPFSFSIIKYPWMDQPLHVQWPY